MPYVTFGPWAQMGRLFGTIFRLVLLGLLTSLVMLVAQRPVERLAGRVAAEPIKAGLVGFLAEILFLPVLVLTVVILAVSIIGIPLLLLVPFALIALLFALLYGFTGAAYGIGRLVGERFGWTTRQPYVVLILGVLAIFTPLLAARIFGLAGGLFHAFALALAAVGFLVEYAAWTAGFGAALMGAFARRPPPTGGEMSGVPAPSAPPEATGAQLTGL